MLALATGSWQVWAATLKEAEQAVLRKRPAGFTTVVSLFARLTLCPAGNACYHAGPRVQAAVRGGAAQSIPPHQHACVSSSAHLEMLHLLPISPYPTVLTWDASCRLVFPCYNALFSTGRSSSPCIGLRRNQAGGGGLPVISVDLHCAFVHEALETGESGIRNLPEVGQLWHADHGRFLYEVTVMPHAPARLQHSNLQCSARPWVSPACHCFSANLLFLLCPSGRSPYPAAWWCATSRAKGCTAPRARPASSPRHVDPLSFQC